MWPDLDSVKFLARLEYGLIVSYVTVSVVADYYFACLHVRFRFERFPFWPTLHEAFFSPISVFGLDKLLLTLP